MLGSALASVAGDTDRDVIGQRQTGAQLAQRCVGALNVLENTLKENVVGQPVLEIAGGRGQFEPRSLSDGGDGGGRFFPIAGLDSREKSVMILPLQGVGGT